LVAVLLLGMTLALAPVHGYVLLQR
jgi:hypothetical protein